MPARPLSRRLIRKAFQIVGGRRYSHWEEGWPHLDLLRPEGGRAGMLRWRGRAVAPLLPASAFAGQVGEELVIFGSGPSLRGQDLGSVAAGSALLLNGALTLAPRLGGALAAAISDERFVWPHLGMIRAHLPGAGLLMLSPAVMRALMTLAPDLLDGRDIVLRDDLQKPYRRPRRGIDELGAGVLRDGPAALSLDPGAGVVSVGTVAAEALQFALAARPRRIGLAGIDISNAGGPRFYDEARPQPSYLGPKQARILGHFALARDHAAARGIALECYSPVSALLGIGIAFSDRLAPRDGALAAAPAQATMTRVPTGTRS